MERNFKKIEKAKLCKYILEITTHEGREVSLW